MTTDQPAALDPQAQAQALLDRIMAGRRAGAVEVLRHLGAEVREEWGVRWDWLDHDREPIVNWFPDRAMAESERDRPYREFFATLIRRLHLTLPAETVEEPT